jgi:hypothetical protein
METQIENPKSRITTAGRSHANANTLPGEVAREGRRVASGSVVHALASHTVVLANECPRKYERLRQAFLDEWQPANRIEECFVMKLCNSYWRLCRLWVIETMLIDSAMFAVREDSEMAPSFPAGMRAVAAIGVLNRGKRLDLDTIRRDELHLSRLVERSLFTLRKLRSARGVHADPAFRARTAEAGITAGAVPRPHTHHTSMASLLSRALTWLQPILSSVAAMPGRITSSKTIVSWLVPLLVALGARFEERERSREQSNEQARDAAESPQESYGGMGPSRSINAEPAESHAPAFLSEFAGIEAPAEVVEFLAASAGTFHYPERLNYEVTFRSVLESLPGATPGAKLESAARPAQCRQSAAGREPSTHPQTTVEPYY